MCRVGCIIGSHKVGMSRDDRFGHVVMTNFERGRDIQGNFHISGPGTGGGA